MSTASIIDNIIIQDPEQIEAFASASKPLSSAL